VDLTWNAPAECPTRDRLLAEVATGLGPAHASRASTVARADARRDDAGRWHATLVVETGGAASQRELEAESCAAIVSAVAVILAVTIEGGTEAAPAAGAAVAATPRSPPPSAHAAPSFASRALVAAGGVVDVGTLPAVSPGVEASLGWMYASARWQGRIVAMGEYFASQTRTNALGEGGSFTLMNLSGRGCVSRAWSTLEIGPCLGGEVDAMTGHERNAQQALPNSAAWLSVVGSALAGWRPSRVFGVSLRVDGVVPLARPTFVIQEPSANRTVYPLGVIAARAVLSAELRFF